MKIRRMVCEGWEVAAMLAGTMVQKRVPAYAPGVFLRDKRGMMMVPNVWRDARLPGDLFWVAEPYVEAVNRRNKLERALGFHGDHGGQFPTVPVLSRAKSHDMRTVVHDAMDMGRGDSRLTLEVTAVRHGRLHVFLDGDFQREAWGNSVTNSDDFDFAGPWNRRYGKDMWQRGGDALVISFGLHRAHVTAVLHEREVGPVRRSGEAAKPDGGARIGGQP